MKRTEIQRKAPMSRGRGFKLAEPKPGKGPRVPKMRKCKCGCGEKYVFDPLKSFICWASEECAVKIAKARLDAQKAKKAKAVRAETKRLREEQKGVKYHLKKTETLVNRYVRLRDKYDGCISCHMPSHYDGIWTASHFKSVGSNSALRYNLWNIHKGCEQCNLFKSGNIAEYERRLVLKIGPERVEWLKNHERVRKFDVEYLMRLQAIIRKKIKRLEKKYGKEPS